MTTGGSSATNFWTRNIAHLLAAAALLVSVAGVILSYHTSQEALDIANDTKNKADASTVIGGIIEPPKLSDGLCYRFHGYQKNLPGSSSLWIAVHAIGDPVLYVARADSNYPPSESDLQAAHRVDSNSQPWVTTVQLGDDTRAENSLDYAIDLFYADSAQAKELTKSRGQKLDTLPAGVESHHLGTTISLSHPPHVQVANFTCSMNNAR
ncbi:hypothetical protein [Amycolatopsis vastitatis]|uniref:hypothetical protein n=1 Tax=Amycolatopsis vastitatis TaxID=1905142 RepID=UPI00117763AB|nr:hypothetical protein [Amycolatopsis vastitatis]